jgi:hypothetical protein
VENQQHLHGHGIIQTEEDGREVPVYYDVIVERQTSEDGPDKLTISGRVGVGEDPWLEALIIDHGRILVLDDGRRLEVRVRESGRGVTTLPFRARPLDEAEFAS